MSLMLKDEEVMDKIRSQRESIRSAASSQTDLDISLNTHARREIFLKFGT